LGCLRWDDSWGAISPLSVRSDSCVQGLNTLYAMLEFCLLMCDVYWLGYCCTIAARHPWIAFVGTILSPFCGSISCNMSFRTSPRNREKSVVSGCITGLWKSQLFRNRSDYLGLRSHFGIDPVVFGCLSGSWDLYRYLQMDTPIEGRVPFFREMRICRKFSESMDRWRYSGTRGHFGRAELIMDEGLVINVSVFSGDRGTFRDREGFPGITGAIQKDKRV
jgi:hypothetical protein